MDSRIFCSVKKVCPKYFSDYCTVDQFHVIFSKWEWIFILKHCLIFSHQDILLWLLTKRFMIKYNALIFMAFLKNCPLCFHCIFQGKVKEVFWTRRLPIYQSTVWKNKKFTLTQKISWNQLFSNFFHQYVGFTNFLSKKCESKFQ